ncbi:GIY-YIG nuclease family protein [Streptomyces europaeiscabiei]|uniref:GIY-YIG nuclease family protein n=1 Tax=Streptomyces europaeiscabiei TaxID=146819 RepID=UPI003990A342
MTTFLYAISSSEQLAPVKIGKSGDVLKRLRQLQTASPVPLQVWWQRETTDPGLEGKLHRHFAAQRLSGEWFHFPGTDWPGEIAQAADFLEQHYEQGTRPRTKQRGKQSLLAGHTHPAPSGIPEWALEGAGKDGRCKCGHTSTSHGGPAPYSCGGLIPEWSCDYGCECLEFRSDVSWSPSDWLAMAADCSRCRAAKQG